MSSQPDDHSDARDEVVRVRITPSDPGSEVEIHLLGTRYSESTWDAWAGADFLGKISRTERHLRKPVLGGLFLSRSTEPRPLWSADRGRGLPDPTHHQNRDDAIRHLYGLNIGHR